MERKEKTNKYFAPSISLLNWMVNALPHIPYKKCSRTSGKDLIFSPMKNLLAKSDVLIFTPYFGMLTSYGVNSYHSWNILAETLDLTWRHVYIGKGIVPSLILLPWSLNLAFILWKNKRLYHETKSLDRFCYNIRCFSGFSFHKNNILWINEQTQRENCSINMQ